MSNNFTNSLWTDNTVQNVREFTKLLYHKAYVKFDDIYDVFE